MNSSKRSSNSSKNNTNRNRNREASTSRHLLDDSESFLNNLPLIKQSENSRLLPRYSAILSRTQDDGVNMDDLDQLQLDLEELISTCAVRSRYLRTEIDLIERGGSNNNGNIDDRRDRKGKSNDRGSLKRKRTDDNRTSKYHRDSRLTSTLQTTSTTTSGVLGVSGTTTTTTRPLKKHYTIPTTLITDPTLRNDLPKINLPKNDTSDKFWASVEPYCSPIQQTHSLFLDKLIDECSQDIEIKIPELGDYYANEWNDTTLNDEQEMGSNGKNINTNGGGGGGSGNSLKRNGLNAMIDTFSNPKTQRLLAVLIEERVMTSFPGVTGKLKPSDLSILKSAAGGRSAICMDRRLKKDLVEQGILSVDDLVKNQQDDEILQEIKKCQQELTTINEYNVDELTRLKEIVKKDMKRQEIKQQLDKIDTQILELYNKILITKQKSIQQHQNDIDLDKNGFTKILKEFEGQTALLLKQQYQLQKELNELNVV